MDGNFPLKIIEIKIKKMLSGIDTHVRCCEVTGDGRQLPGKDWGDGPAAVWPEAGNWVAAEGRP